MDEPKVVKLAGISTEDTIIAIMGPTGAGKSTFINMAIQQDSVVVGHRLQSCTEEIRAVRVAHPTNGRPIVFVDTPGFDDTNKSDTKILKMIAQWLEQTYKNMIKVAGIVYMHRISDNRMAGTPLRNLQMFANLCGDEAIRNVVLATTMWSDISLETGTSREAELRQVYWKSMLNLGSATARFKNDFQSAWEIVDSLIDKTSGDPLLLQEELVDLNRRLSETKAGQTLYSTLQDLLANQKEMVQQLRHEAEIQRNQDLVRELNAQWEKLQLDLQTTFDQIEEIRVPLGRRVRLFFTFRRSRAHALEIG